jgi:hypothetical protein
MKGSFDGTFRQEDYAGIGDDELSGLYDEGRRRLSEIGAIVPDAADAVLDPGDLWLRVAFLESVIRYELER